MTWHWRLPQPLYDELDISEAELATRALIRRATLNSLRGQEDTYTAVLVALYVAARRIKPTITLHDLIAVQGAPEHPQVPPHVPFPWMVPVPNQPGVYLATPLLRRRQGFALDEQTPMRVEALAALCGLHKTTLQRMEDGKLQPKVSTLVNIYTACLSRDPSLTLHDVLLIHEPELQPRPLLRSTARSLRD